MRHCSDRFRRHSPLELIRGLLLLTASRRLTQPSEPPSGLRPDPLTAPPSAANHT